jgi:hypothetical protein
VPCLLENRFEGLNAPSNGPVIGNALIFSRSKVNQRNIELSSALQICVDIQLYFLLIFPCRSPCRHRHRFAAVLAVLLIFSLNSMEEPPQQLREPTQTQSTTDSQLNLTKFVPIRSVPRNNSLEADKPWYHLFRPSLLGPNISQSSQPQSFQSEDRSFQFCQSRLIAATEDLSKLLQSVSSTFTQEKTSLETLIDSTRKLIETTRDENNTRHDNRMKEGASLSVIYLLICSRWALGFSEEIN